MMCEVLRKELNMTDNLLKAKIAALEARIEFLEAAQRERDDLPAHPHPIEQWRDGRNVEVFHSGQTAEIMTHESTFINCFRYSFITGQLLVVMKSGESYLYTDVPIQVFRDLRTTHSVGKYYTYNIKGLYRSEKVK